MRADDVATDGQAEARPVGRGVAHGVGSEEPVEQLRLLFRRDARAVVAHGAPHVHSVSAHTGAHGAAVVVVVHGVGQEVAAYLADGVRGNRKKVVWGQRVSRRVGAGGRGTHKKKKKR